MFCSCSSQEESRSRFRFCTGGHASWSQLLQMTGCWRATTSPHPPAYCPSCVSWCIWTFTADVGVLEDCHHNDFSVEIVTQHAKSISVSLSIALVCLVTLKQTPDSYGNLSLGKGQSPVQTMYQFKIYRVYMLTFIFLDEFKSYQNTFSSAVGRLNPKSSSCGSVSIWTYSTMAVTLKICIFWGLLFH